jgi:hypothetical protein
MSLIGKPGRYPLTGWLGSGHPALQAIPREHVVQRTRGV